MKQKWAKVIAILALIAIIWSIIWTWLMVIFSSLTKEEMQLTPEQIEQIQELINSQSWSTTWTWEVSWTWNIIEINN